MVVKTKFPEAARQVARVFEGTHARSHLLAYMQSERQPYNYTPDLMQRCFASPEETLG